MRRVSRRVIPIFILVLACSSAGLAGPAKNRSDSLRTTTNDDNLIIPPGSPTNGNGIESGGAWTFLRRVWERICLEGN